MELEESQKGAVIMRGASSTRDEKQARNRPFGDAPAKKQGHRAATKLGS